MSPSSRLRLPALALVLVLVVAACGAAPHVKTAASPLVPAGASPASSASGGPSPSANQPATPPATDSAASGTPSAPSSAEAALYAQIEANVQQIRGLTTTKPFVPTLLDEQGVRDYMTKAFEQQVNRDDLAKQARLYKALGMMPQSADLYQLELDLQSSQVIGFYDDITKRLYVVSETGTVGPIQKVTFAHEFTHALQDQHFGLAKLQLDTADQSDRDQGRLALVEGDATLSMSQWMLKYLSPGELLQITQDPSAASQQAQLDASPAILRESLTFPYVQGLAFVQHLYATGGWAAVNDAFSKPPASTSQVIHPELYDQGVQPVAVSLPAVPSSLGSGWKQTLQDTFGEFQLAVWVSGAASSTVAAGWAGDRVGLYEGPNGAWAVVMDTAWRSPSAANSFAARIAGPPHAQGSVTKVCTGTTSVNIVVASDQATLDAFAAACPA